MEKPMNSIQSIRKDWDLIESLINERSRVLDVGCGEGELIQQLEKNLQANVHGVEKDQGMALKGIAKGLNITHGDAEKDLFQYANQSFDYVILSQTLQAMIEPKKILTELLRVGSKAIVSFPNFGYWRVRVSLAFKGCMPRTRSLPHQWYDTPNIHFCTIADFVTLCDELKITIEKSLTVNNKGLGAVIGPRMFTANLMGEQAVFLLNSDGYQR